MTDNALTPKVDGSGVWLERDGESVTLVTEHELEDAGWQYKPECELRHLDEVSDRNPTEELKRWHDEDSGHAGPFKFCYEAPCKPVRDAFEEWV